MSHVCVTQTAKAAESKMPHVEQVAKYGLIPLLPLLTVSLDLSQLSQLRRRDLCPWSLLRLGAVLHVLVSTPWTMRGQTRPKRQVT